MPSSIFNDDDMQFGTATSDDMELGGDEDEEDEDEEKDGDEEGDKKDDKDDEFDTSAEDDM